MAYTIKPLDKTPVAQIAAALEAKLAGTAFRVGRFVVTDGTLVLDGVKLRPGALPRAEVRQESRGDA